MSGERLGALRAPDVPSSRDICVERTMMTVGIDMLSRKMRSGTRAASRVLEGTERRPVCSTWPYLGMEGGVGCLESTTVKREHVSYYRHRIKDHGTRWPSS